MTRKAGRPRAENPRKMHAVYLTDEEWQFCQTQPGGGSEFIRQMIIDFREFTRRGEQPPWLQGDTASNENEDPS